MQYALTDWFGYVSFDLHPLVGGYLSLLLLLLRMVLRVLLLMMMPMLMGMLQMTGLLQDVIGRRIRILLFVMTRRVRGKVALRLYMRLVVQRLVRRW